MLQASHTVSFQEPQRVSYLKMDEVDYRACSQIVKSLLLQTSVNCEFEFFLLLFLAKCTGFALLDYQPMPEKNTGKQKSKQEKGVILSVSVGGGRE